MDDLIELAIIMLSKNVMLSSYAGIQYPDGSPAKIVKYRNFSGVEVKTRQLTLSVFPYHYEGGSRPTPDSPNASITFKPLNFTGPDPTRPDQSIDLAIGNVKVQLALLGYAQATKSTTTTTTATQTGLFGTTIPVQQNETSGDERVLRQWMEYLRVVLTSDLFNLNGWVKSSQVNWINFPTTQWDEKGNLILHVAELMWQLQYYALREWKPDHIVRGRDPLLGALQADGSPVFYRPDQDILVTGFGVLVLTTPSGIPITWDPTQSALVNKTTKIPLSSDQLLDTGSGKPFIRLDLLPVGVLTTGDIPLYYNRTSSQLVQFDGTVLSQIPGPNAKLVAPNLPPNGTLDLTDKTAWIQISWDSVNNRLVYGPGDLRAGQPVDPADMVDPSTGDLYLMTGQMFGLNFEVRPRFREFLIFGASV